jgi:hypothetical protein
LAKDWQKVEKLCHNYFDDKDVNPKHDADFFLSLASIIISTKDAKICEVVTSECTDDTFERKKLSAQQQTRLTSLAATSLEKAIDLSTSSETPPFSKIILPCRWYADHIFNFLISFCHVGIFGMLWRPIHVAVSNFSSRRYLKKAIQSKPELEPLSRISGSLMSCSTRVPFENRLP